MNPTRRLADVPEADLRELLERSMLDGELRQVFRNEIAKALRETPVRPSLRFADVFWLVLYAYIAALLISVVFFAIGAVLAALGFGSVLAVLLGIK